jgi:hypothetical protein
MTPRKITLLCLPVALAGIGLSARATFRVQALEGDLAVLAATAKAEGESFARTLRGEHAERQRAAFDERRVVALSLAAARRDRMLGLAAAVGSGLAAAGLFALSRISAEIDEDRRHLRAQSALPPPDGR